MRVVRYGNGKVIKYRGWRKVGDAETFDTKCETMSLSDRTLLAFVGLLMLVAAYFFVLPRNRDVWRPLAVGIGVPMLLFSCRDHWAAM